MKSGLPEQVYLRLPSSKMSAYTVPYGLPSFDLKRKDVWGE